MAKNQAMLPASPTEMIVPEQQPQQMGADHKDQAMVPASPTQGAMVPEQGTEQRSGEGPIKPDSGQQ